MEGDGKDSLVHEAESAISTCVRRFYEKGSADSLLGPIFREAIPELESHLEVVVDFWSHALLGTTRYQGTPFGVHVNLPIEPEHFARWLTLFTESAIETMPEGLASVAIGRAEHMSRCFQSGLFPFEDSEGRPARVPGNVKKGRQA